MPVKSHTKRHHARHPKHYAKVYWPYMPLLIVVGLSLLVSHSFVARSQSEVLSYSTNVTAEALLQASNQKRSSKLELDQELNKAAQAKANDMVARDYWSHVTPEGKSPWAFIESTNYEYQKAGENLAYGFASSQETVNGWMNSQSHRENLLDQDYTEVGFGIANSQNYIGQGQQTVIVSLYARPESAKPIESKSTGVSEQNAFNLPVNSTRPLNIEPQVKAVSKIQAFTGGTIPSVTFLIGLLSGLGLAYLVLKHSIGLKRFVHNGEKFVMKHPLLDITIASFIVLCLLLTKSVGVIR